MLPSPQLHHHEKDYQDSNVYGEHRIANEQKDPHLQVKSYLCECGPRKVKERHPEAPFNRHAESPGHIDALYIRYVAKGNIECGVSNTLYSIQFSIEKCHIAVADENKQLHDEN